MIGSLKDSRQGLETIGGSNVMIVRSFRKNRIFCEV